MQGHVGTCRLELVVGDITRQALDVIVNAANSMLAGGGGVDGAIHRAGGPTIMAETRERYPQGCPTGSAVLTGGGTLPARYVIHAVGPIWHGGQAGEAAHLAGAYRHCLHLAAQEGCRSVALPSLSTGAYRYPVASAARTALTTVVDYLQGQQQLTLVRFVLFDQGTYDVYAAVLRGLPLQVIS